MTLQEQIDALIESVKIQMDNTTKLVGILNDHANHIIELQRQNKVLAAKLANLQARFN